MIYPQLDPEFSLHHLDPCSILESWTGTDVPRYLTVLDSMSQFPGTRLEEVLDSGLWGIPLASPLRNDRISKAPSSARTHLFTRPATIPHVIQPRQHSQNGATLST